MLEWLKTILGDAYTEDIDKKVSGEIGKGYVPKADYTAVETAKKQAEQAIGERDRQMEQLKASTGDAETLKQQIIDLQAANQQKDAEHAMELQKVRVDSAVEKALLGAKAKNLKAARALLELDPAKAEFDDAGNLKGLDEQIKKLKTSEDAGFLFEAEKQAAPVFKGFQPGEKRDGLPGAPTQPASLADAVKMALMPEQ